MFSFGFKRVWKNKANTKFDICSSSFKSVERNWASFKKKTFCKCFPFSDSNTVVVSSEMIDQKVIHKFIILLLNSAQRLILALGMWNSQELFRLFRLKTRSSNTDLRWRGANLLLVTCMCPLLAFKKKKNEQLVLEQDKTTSPTTLLFSGVAWQKFQNKIWHFCSSFTIS